jgi:hypothetical protein
MLRALITATFFSSAIGVATQGDVFSTLGTTLRGAQDTIFSSVATGVPAAGTERAAFKAATAQQRAAIVKSIAAVARTFVASDEFARRYALYREAQKPKRSTAARTGDEARAHQRDAIDLAVKQALANAAKMPPEARQQLEASIAEMRRQVAELNADPAYRAQVDAAATAAAAEDDAEFARQLAVFESEFPQQVNELLRRRLRSFLLACSEVDFDARLEAGPGNTMQFVSAAHERRSAEWKMCYRAGRPAVETARAVAEDWLKTLVQDGF